MGGGSCRFRGNEKSVEAPCLNGALDHILPAHSHATSPRRLQHVGSCGLPPRPFRPWTAFRSTLEVPACFSLVVSLVQKMDGTCAPVTPHTLGREYRPPISAQAVSPVYTPRVQCLRVPGPLWVDRGAVLLSPQGNQGTGISSQRKYNPQRADSARFISLVFHHKLCFGNRL